MEHSPFPFSVQPKIQKFMCRSSVFQFFGGVKDLIFCYWWRGVASLTGHICITVLVLLFGGSKANPAALSHSQLDVNRKKPLQTFRPYNIAHRGSNGELPEETAAAYLVTKSLFFSHTGTELFSNLHKHSLKMIIARICGDIVYWHIKLNYMNILVYNTQVNYGLSRWRHQHIWYIKKALNMPPQHLWERSRVECCS